MRTVHELVRHTPAFEALTDDQLALLAGCGELRSFRASELLMREGASADAFFVIREGAVAIETFVPGRGGQVLETLHDDDVVGWSWIVPPHRVQFDARAIGVVHTLAFDGACLRAKCDADPALGYALMQRFAAVLAERLGATRIRLLDLYGHAGG